MRFLPAQKKGDGIKEVQAFVETKPEVLKRQGTPIWYYITLNTKSQVLASMGYTH